jgi:hypothetical protein
MVIVFSFADKESARLTYRRLKRTGYYLYKLVHIGAFKTENNNFLYSLFLFQFPYAFFWYACLKRCGIIMKTIRVSFFILGGKLFSQIKDLDPLRDCLHTDTHIHTHTHTRIWCPEAEETVEHRAYDKSLCFFVKIRTEVEETIEFQAYNAA